MEVLESFSTGLGNTLVLEGIPFKITVVYTTSVYDWLT
jgi:hypothetical protein